MIIARTGNEAMAEAMRQINPDVVAAYPITPATEIVQIFSSFVANGLVDTEYVAVESEHSAMSACMGAAAAGARVMTGTASQGLALMYEVLYIAAGLRLPIVLCLVNRSLSSPINIHCDHSDSMGARDSGWIQILTERTQEAYDSVIQAVLIAEKTLLPIMVTIDGFIISHAMEDIEMIDDKEVRDFVGKRKAKYSLLDIDHPITIGGLDLTDYYFEHKMSEIDAMNHVLPVLEEVNKLFASRFKRSYPVVEEYKCDDAEVAILAMGSTVGTARVAVDQLRSEGKKVGLVKVRAFRPFPIDLIRKAMAKMKVVGVLDRSDSVSTNGGQLYIETRSVLYEEPKKPLLANYVYGLGGRDINIEEIREIYNQLLEIKAQAKVKTAIQYYGVRS